MRRGTGPRRLVLTMVAFGAIVAGLVLSGSPSAARVVHAELLSTEPANGDVLDSAPDQVLLRFNERVQTDGDSIEVFDSSGDQLDTGDLTKAEGGAVVASALPELDEGAYVVGWHVVSTDGHPIRGAFVFRMGEAADAAAADAEAEALMERLVASQGGDTTVGAAYGVVRFVAFAGMVLLVGGAAFVLVLWPAGVADGRGRRLLVGGWVTVLVVTVVAFGFQGAYTAGEGPGGLVDLSLVGDVVDTRTGVVWLVRLALLVLVVPLGWMVLRSADPRRTVRAVPWAVWGVLGVALLATISLAGHAGTGDLVPLALAVDVTHLAAVSFWLAGLAFILLVLLRADDESDREHVVAGFSTLAAWAVVVIVATGTIQAWRQIGTFEALTDTTFGRLVIVKVLLFAAILGAAALSRQWVRRQAMAPRPALSPGPGAMAIDATAVPSPARLRRSVLAEAAGAAVVLAVTALLVNTVPGEDALDPTFTTAVHGGAFQVQVEVDPARTGTADIRIETLSHAGEVVEPDEVTATMSLPARDLGPIDLELHPDGPGAYVAHDAEIPFAGTWQLEVEARTGEFDEESIPVEVPVR